MFATVRIRDWQELKSIFASRSSITFREDKQPERTGWIFRGQARAEWPLETTLYREATRLNLHSLNAALLQDREVFLIEEFKRFAHHYLRELPADGDNLAWLAIMQHFGAPTRLLDFTTSMYVGAFFAVDNADSEAALWAIDLLSLETAACNRLKFFPTGGVSQIRAANASRLFERREDRGHPAVLCVEPSRLHERIWVQKGLFLAPTDPNESFMNCLQSSFFRRSDPFTSSRPRRWNDRLGDRTSREFPQRGYLSVVKFVLPRSIHGEILNDLESMNISSATLFPGPEGFARSLRHRIWPSIMWLHDEA